MRNKEKRAAYNKAYRCRPGFLEMERSRNKRHRIKTRTAALQAYGGKCACCGEAHYEFMALDHINGGGNKERQELGRNASYLLCARLSKQGWPSGYRVLCHNCNMARGFYGRCPHEG